MEIHRTKRFLFDIISLGGGFGLAMMVSINQATQNESELRELININQRLLHHCYVYEGDGVPTLLPTGGYRAQCTMDYDGLFIIEDTLELPGDFLD